MSEKIITWGQVVEGDEVKSQNGKWHKVDYLVALMGDGHGRTRVRLIGVRNPIVTNLTDAVTVRRGPTGQASDVLMTVLYSGPAR